MPESFAKPDTLLGGPAVWRGDELVDADEWIHAWTPEEIAELDDALVAVQALRRPLGKIGRDDFPLPRLGDRLHRLRADLLRGRGFVLMRGLDASKYSRDEIATIFWGIGAHLGRAVPQNAQGHLLGHGAHLGRAVPQNAQGHLLGHVKDLGRDSRDASARIYQTSERQGYHTDSADIVGLLCLEPSMEGGRSSLVSCPTIHNVLFERSPDLLAELFQPFSTDHRGEHPADAHPYFTAPILSWHEDELSVLYQRRYIESAQRFAAVPRLTGRQVEALDAFDAVADDPGVHLEMQLERGDIQFIHNHQMLHDRTAFRDWPEPDRRRHLLRLWLCPEGGRPLPPWFAERLGSVEPGDRGGVALKGVEPVIPPFP